jgi:hypothetical protein
MYWYDITLPIFRSLINDFDETSYSNQRLLTIMLHSSYLVSRDVELVNTYVINIANETIVPDPNDDPDFINLILLRSVLLVAQGEYRTASSEAVIIKDGPSTIELNQTMSAKDILSQAQQNYDNAVLNYRLGVSSVGKAILSPYTQEYL